MIKEVTQFKEESMRGDYYAPFDMNSKNYMNIPEETNRWFEKLAELLLESSRLTELEKHDDAIQYFSILFECIDEMESGNEIVFADESGMWMLPTREEHCIKAYIQSAAAVLSPAQYIETILPLIKRDNRDSFYNKVYEKAIHAASAEQKDLLNKKIASEKIKIK